MKWRLTILACSVSLAGGEASAAVLMQEVDVAGAAAVLADAAIGRTIAVVGIAPRDGAITPAMEALTERLTTALVRRRAAGVRVVERSQLKALLDAEQVEAAMASSAALAASAAKVGADGVVIGVARREGSRTVVNARLVDIATLNVLAAVRFTVDIDEQPVRAAGEAPPPRAAAAPPAVRAVGVHLTVMGCWHEAVGARCAAHIRNMGGDRDIEILTRHAYDGTTAGYDEEPFARRADGARVAMERCRWRSADAPSTQAAIGFGQHIHLTRGDTVSVFCDLPRWPAEETQMRSLTWVLMGFQQRTALRVPLVDVSQAPPR